MISVCIPTKNAGPEFVCNLGAWQHQVLGEPVELVIVDSGSSDQTVRLARDLGARVFTIPPSEFNHGETRNLLARHACGDLLVFTVQDAWPVNEVTLAELTSPLRRSPDLAGVAGKQEPRPDADFFARWEVEVHNLHFDKGPRVRRLNSLAEFLAADFFGRFDQLSFDNVCAAVRRTAWEGFPFSAVSFAEDLDWSFRVQTAGGLLFYNPAARVYHSHNHPPYKRLKRYFVGRRATNRIFRMPPELDLSSDEQVLAGIGGFWADLSPWLSPLCPEESKPSLRLPRSFPHLLRRVFARCGLPGGERLTRWLPGNFARDLLRQRFNYACYLLRRLCGSLSPSQWKEAALQLANMQTGDFLGQYYHSCELRGRVPDWLAELGVAWSRGV